jgi:hypothetical protein
MSYAIRERLASIPLPDMRTMLDKTTHEHRVEIDKRIEEYTGKYCDEGVFDLTDEEFQEIVDSVLEGRPTVLKKKRILAKNEIEQEIHGC